MPDQLPGGLESLEVGDLSPTRSFINPHSATPFPYVIPESELPDLGLPAGNFQCVWTGSPVLWRISNIAMEANALHAHPIFSGPGGTANRLLMEVTNATVGSLFRFGLYDCDQRTLFPVNLLAESGEQDGNVIGAKVAAVNLVLRPFTWYSFVSLGNALQPKIVANGATGFTPTGSPFLVYNTAGAGALNTVLGYMANLAYGPLPTLFPQSPKGYLLTNSSVRFMALCGITYA